MKGRYVFDVEGVSALNKLIFDKAVALGCKDETDDSDRTRPTIFVNLDKAVVSASELDIEARDVQYGLNGFERLSITEFLRMEKPVPKVALGLVITDDLDNPEMGEPRMVTEADLKEFDFEITRDHVMAAAEQACRALGV